MALLAAGFGAWLLWRQIQTQERHEAERRRRRFAAARATMPLLLSGICQYARDVANILTAIHGPAGQHGFGADNLIAEVPALPAELPASLERLIESTGSDELASQLADILDELQVMHARISELPRLPSHMTGLQLMIEDYMLHTARIYAAASSLFDYARRRTDDPTAGDRTTIRSALNLLEMRDYEFERLHQTAARRFNLEYSNDSELAAGGVVGTAIG